MKIIAKQVDPEHQDSNFDKVCAHEFIEGLKRLANDEYAAENFECYLSYHFAEWLQKFANTPEGITSEIIQFSKINMED